MGKMRVSYNPKAVEHITGLMELLQLNTVCGAANCPNMGECFQNRTATFLIMGSLCSRNCRFCNVANGKPEPLDPMEPERLAHAVSQMGLRHVVITSVTRDDLIDGGASHFARVIEQIRENTPQVTIEVLIPDMKGDSASLDTIIEAAPDVINHNMETVVSLYERVRPEADYDRSIKVLQYVKRKRPEILTKTGIMTGLGEREEQVFSLMDDVRAAGCELLTVGQYLQPSTDHIAVREYISEAQFKRYERAAYDKGFRHVASGPLVRSSYRAEEAFTYEK